MGYWIIQYYKPLIEQLTEVYHQLTQQLGELIVESVDEDPAEFRRYFDLKEPYLAASLNHNYSLEVFSDEAKKAVRDSYARFDADNVGAHIDGPPFIALLINDRPGLQVVAGEGDWVNAPVACRTASGEYDVPVIENRPWQGLFIIGRCQAIAASPIQIDNGNDPVLLV